MTISIALALLFVFTTTVAILITVWAERANTRVEQIPKENKAQIWSIIDDKIIPWSEKLDTRTLLIHEGYTPCRKPLSEIEANDD